MIVLLDFGVRVLKPLGASCQVRDIPIPRPRGIGFDEIEMVSQVAEVLRFTCICTFSARTESSDIEETLTSRHHG
jgi:hypothetical protein